MDQRLKTTSKHKRAWKTTYDLFSYIVLLDLVRSQYSPFFLIFSLYQLSECQKLLFRNAMQHLVRQSGRIRSSCMQGYQITLSFRMVILKWEILKAQQVWIRSPLTNSKTHFHTLANQYYWRVRVIMCCLYNKWKSKLGGESHLADWELVKIFSSRMTTRTPFKNYWLSLINPFLLEPSFRPFLF